MNRLRATRIVAAALVLLGVPVFANGSLAVQRAEAQAAPPNPPVVDNFNRGSENPLSDGGKWTGRPGVDPLFVTNDQLACGTWPWTCEAWRNEVRYGVDQEAAIRLPIKPGNEDWIRLGVRLQMPTEWSGYAVTLLGSASVDQVVISRVDERNFTTLQTLSQEFSQNDKLAVRALGSTIEAWRYDDAAATWAKLGEAIDTRYVGVGYMSVGMTGTGQRADDFAAATLQPGTPDTTPPIDDFNRPNENPVSDAGKWSQRPGVDPLFVTSNQLACGTSPWTCEAWRNAVRYGVDQEASIRLATKPASGEWVRLSVRLQMPGVWSGYAVTFQGLGSGPDQVTISRIDDRNFTTLTTFSQEFMHDDKLKARAVGSTIEAWRYDNGSGTWTKLGQATDPNYVLDGYTGVGMTGTGQRGDDFAAGNVGPPPSQAPPPGQSNGTTGGRGGWALTGTTTILDPVNSRTGAFVTQVEDLTTPGTGVPFGWMRSYTSSDATVGPLGPGWTHTYAASLTVQANGDVLARGEEGQELYFTKQANGSFVGAPGALADLTSVAGGYELKRSDQVVYAFNASGRLLSIKDRNNQGVTLDYDAQGRLATVTDAAGKQVTVSYNASSLVSQVSTQDGRSIAYGYTAGRLTTVTDVRGKPWAYAYDAGGRLESIVDPLGHRQVFNVYDANGRVQSQTDAVNKTTNFAWDPATEIATATDANNKAWKHDYTDGVLAKEIDPLNNETVLGHDTDLNATAVTSPTNQTTAMTYDAAGNLLTATAPPSLGSAQKTFTYTTRNDPDLVTDARGKVTDYAYNPTTGNLTSVTQDGIQVGAYTYDAAGRVLTFTDGRNKTTTYTYFPATGYLESVTDHAGNKTTYTYDPAGRVATRVDPKGNVAGCGCAAQFTWTYTFNPAGQQLTESDPLGQTTTNVYDDAGRLTSTTDANGHTTTYTYDNANRLLTETAPDPDGAGPQQAPFTTSTYDNVGNKLTETDPRGNTTTFAYNGANQLISETGPDPDGAGPLAAPVTTHTYDANGNLASTVEPRGNAAGANPDEYRMTYTYDAAGRLLTETRPDPDGAGPALSPKTTNTYDPVGNLGSVKDGNDHVTSYTYDAAGRILTVTAPDLGLTTYTYDGAGNVLTRKDDNNHVTTYAYDDAGRLVSETSPDPDGPGPGGPAVPTYTYDPNGNRLTVTDPNGNATGTAGDGVTTSGYDRANRLASINYADATPDVSFTYDNVGNRLTMADGSGTETRTYDNLDRLLTLTRGSNTFSYMYDNAGNVTRRTYPGSVVTDYSYDPLNRLTSVASGGQTTSYAYDVASNLTTTALPSGNGYVETRTYDRPGRLIDVESQKGGTTLAKFALSLDPAGNPLSVVRTGSLAQTQTYTYDASDRLLTVCFQAGTCPGATDPFIRWTYDKVGNRLTEQRPGQATTSYGYDFRDRLLSAGSTSYTYDQNGNELSAGTRTFTYDLANRLKTTTQSSTTTTYSYDGDGVRLQASTGSQANKKANFLWDVVGGLPQIALERDGNNSLLRRYTYGEQRISMTSGNNTSYYIRDGLGSTANLTSSSGATQWTWSYEPFGSIRTETKASGSQPDNFMKFTGEYLDPTGLYHLRARQYDPGAGRFLGPDPAGQAPAAVVGSAYAYTANRPTVMTDPSGLVFVPSDIAIGVAAAASSREVTAMDGGTRYLQSSADRFRAKYCEVPEGRFDTIYCRLLFNKNETARLMQAPRRVAYVILESTISKGLGKLVKLDEPPFDIVLDKLVAKALREFTNLSETIEGKPRDPRTIKRCFGFECTTTFVVQPDGPAILVWAHWFTYRDPRGCYAT